MNCRLYYSIVVDTVVERSYTFSSFKSWSKPNLSLASSVFFAGTRFLLNLMHFCFQTLISRINLIPVHLIWFLHFKFDIDRSIWIPFIFGRISHLSQKSIWKRATSLFQKHFHINQIWQLQICCSWNNVDGWIHTWKWIKNKTDQMRTTVLNAICNVCTWFNFDRVLLTVFSRWFYANLIQPSNEC